MFRKLGLLAVACLMVASTEAALASDTLTTPTTTQPGSAPATKADQNERMKKRDYAIELQKKLKKPGPPPSKPKFKPWDEIVTKDHKKVEGLLTMYIKGEEVLLDLPISIYGGG